MYWWRVLPNSKYLLRYGTEHIDISEPYADTLADIHILMLSKSGSARRGHLPDLSRIKEFSVNNIFIGNELSYRDNDLNLKI